MTIIPRDTLIKLSRALLDQREVDAVTQVMLHTAYLGMGSLVREFEEKLQSFLATTRTVVAVNTGTSALHLAVESCCPPGSEVLVPTITFVASYQAIRAARCVPVSCDVDPDSGCLDLADASRRVTPRTRAVMPVHYAGRPMHMHALQSFAKTHGVRVIEDAAHALGSRCDGRMIGAQGDITCFSFDGIKNITCGEGGAIITDDAQVIQRAQDARLLGVEKDTEKRYGSQRSWEFDVKAPGYRYHMGNLYAAIGLTQLAKAPEMFAHRQVLTARYDRALREVKGVQLFPLADPNIVPHIYPIRVLGGRRDALKDALQQYRIETGIHYYPNHWLSLFGGKRGTLPRAEQLYSELLTLPLHCGLGLDDIDYVTEVVRQFLTLHSASCSSC